MDGSSGMQTGQSGDLGPGPIESPPPAKPAGAPLWRRILSIVSVIFLLIRLGLYFIPSDPKVPMGPKGEVIYTGKATKVEAEAVAAGVLKEVPGYGDSEVTVMYSTDKDSKILSFVVKDGSWNDPDIEAGFEAITRSFVGSIGGPPITLRLLNKDKKVEKETVLH